ncbi:TPA: hypothetical protein G8O12_003790 [Salmonella enterica]|uniref:Uncharacterized protein n=1 Tax=Salmonella enterica TaxID=28901 RepID=A0A742RAC0_SALER|nr:hypothetical protein [Salmonella enterica]HAF4640776.1 hypothetical protein [Salmonella enterica]HAF4746700.1 hypothetical protein [Salmonella enterica]
MTAKAVFLCTLARCFAAEKVVSEQIAGSDSPENIDVEKAFEKTMQAV